MGLAFESEIHVLRRSPRTISLWTPVVLLVQH